jgi:hypothetical protein
MMIYMFIGMFLIQYFMISYVMTNQVENSTFSTGKIYMCTIMGLFMVFMDIVMSHKFDVKLFGSITLLIIFFIYLYRIQFGIDDKNYIREMIEHHSMAILTSKNILEKTKNQAVNNIATKILLTQEKEIEDMRYVLKSI